MASIATTHGDSGQTSLAGGVRVSKASLRVEAYGHVDELGASLGFARSITDDREIAEFVLSVQRELFTIGGLLATPASSPKPAPMLEPAMVDRLTAEIHRLEAIEGMLSDWAVPGGHTAAAAYDLARTVCRRAERAVVVLMDSGEAVQPVLLAYLNRLSDLLWLMGRKLEKDAGVDSSLRSETGKSGNRWSRAW
jgi:cob(I)alamin adenosyltransferase